MDKFANIANKPELFKAIDNLEKIISILVDNPVKGIEINQLLKDYNTIRQEINKSLVNK